MGSGDGHVRLRFGDEVGDGGQDGVGAMGVDQVDEGLRVGAAGEIDWDVSVDSTIVRAHQHAAGARTNPPPAPTSKGAEELEHQDETPWQGLHACLVKVVQEVRAWAARAAASPPSST